MLASTYCRYPHPLPRIDDTSIPARSSRICKLHPGTWPRRPALAALAAGSQVPTSPDTRSRELALVASSSHRTRCFMLPANHRRSQPLRFGPRGSAETASVTSVTFKLGALVWRYPCVEQSIFAVSTVLLRACVRMSCNTPGSCPGRLRA